MLAVIGPSWAATDEVGQSRLAEETDWVRIEIEAALAKDIPVIPVLVNGARMPKPRELPETIQDLAFRQATEVDMRRDFHTHMDRLIRVMDQLLMKTRSVEEVTDTESVRAGSDEAEEISLDDRQEAAEPTYALAKKTGETCDLEEGHESVRTIRARAVLAAFKLLVLFSPLILILIGLLWGLR